MTAKTPQRQQKAELVSNKSKNVDDENVDKE